jgi:hypothetical protein
MGAESTIKARRWSFESEKERTPKNYVFAMVKRMQAISRCIAAPSAFDPK